MGRQPNRRPKIYKGADGWYHCYVTVGQKTDGKLDRRHVRGKTATAVAGKLATLEESLRQGHVPEVGPSPTVGAWLEHWLTTIAARKCRPLTLMSYESKIRHRIIPAIGRHRLDKLTPELVEAFYTALEEEVAPATALQIHRILSRALKVAMQRGKIPRNPCALVDAPSAVRAEVDSLDRDEIRRILAEASTRRNAARWLVALGLGLRQGEALGLRWSDVDLDARVPILAVRLSLQRLKWRHGCADPVVCAKRKCKTAPCPDGCRRHTRACPPPCPPGCQRHASTCPQKKGGGLVFGDPKSRRARRTLPVPAVLAQQLREHRKAQVAERLAAGPLWVDHDLVFAQPSGAPINPRADWGEWKQLLEAAGVEHHKLHAARHATATVALADGIPARVVMELLGHSQIALTLGTYSHVLPEILESAAERLGGLMEQLQPGGATTKRRVTG